MASSPLTQNLTLSQMQSKWASILNPVLTNPINSANVLTSIFLKNGTTVVPHMLGRLMQGWFIADQNASASIYRSAPMNSTNLTLTSNAAVTVNLAVF